MQSKGVSILNVTNAMIDTQVRWFTVFSCPGPHDTVSEAHMGSPVDSAVTVRRLFNSLAGYEGLPVSPLSAGTEHRLAGNCRDPVPTTRHSRLPLVAQHNIIYYLSE